VLSIDPASLPAATNLSRLLHMRGQFGEAISCCEAGLEYWPDDFNLLQNLAINLHRAGQFQAALLRVEKLKTLKPYQSTVHYLEARVHDDSGNLPTSLEAYRRAVECDTSDLVMVVALGDALLRAGFTGEALAQFDRALRVNVYDVRALALKTAALAELGRTDEEKWLSDPQRFIKMHRLSELGVSETEQAAFNRRVSEFAAAHHSMKEDPAENATYLGWHSGELGGETDLDIGRIKLFIAHALKQRVSELKDEDPRHPFVTGLPRTFDLRLWSVKMTHGGKMIPHIHPDGWLSGVYYADIPPVVNDPDAAQAGWIRFGPPRNDIKMSAQPLTRTVKPEPGLMVTFPSYFWHSTVPLPEDNTERRLVLAFDVIPGRAPSF